ncbi:hypothetical protein OUZ56_003247 [Daphnia magna]|uniref:Uncharacterized protein n=1 Tax=Daphnia magna TaxID=35525 RepID=A0ABR0A865_9CRUS|nr:hypothetical protein OUZ56_003247 [Daphnia magna]
MNKNVIPHRFPLLQSFGISVATSTSNLAEEPTSVTPTSSSFFIEEELNEREHLNFSNSNVTDDISHQPISIQLKNIGVQTDKHLKLAHDFLVKTVSRA